MQRPFLFLAKKLETTADDTATELRDNGGTLIRDARVNVSQHSLGYPSRVAKVMYCRHHRACITR